MSRNIRHPTGDVAKCINNLAMVYQSHQRYDEAEPLHKRALAIWEKRLGHEHPDTASGLNNPGVLYPARKKYAEAQPFFERALPVWETRLSHEHISALVVIERYTRLLRNTNRTAEAKKLKSRARAIRSKIGSVAKNFWLPNILRQTALHKYSVGMNKSDD